jgi:hypothetical protein
MATNASQRFESDASTDQTTLTTYAQYAAERAAEATDDCPHGVVFCPGSDAVHIEDGEPTVTGQLTCFECWLEATA